MHGFNSIMNNEPTTTTPDHTNEADALAALADLVLVEPDQRAGVAERYEQLRQAWRDYLSAPGEQEKTE